MKRLAIVLAGALLFVALPAQAQNTGDGSVYSRFGVGELRTFGSSQAEAMGGGGYGLRSLNYINLYNPASWGDQVFTRAVGGFRFQNLRASADGVEESILSEGNLGAIQFSFPILRQRLGVALGFEPFSRVGYRVQVAGRTQTDPFGTDTSDYRIDFEGSGGLQQLVGGLGYQITPNVAVGGALHFIFGMIDYGRRTSFPGSRLQPANLVTSTRLTGLAASAGAQFSARSVLANADAATIGLSVRSPSTMDGRRVRRLGESLDVDTLGTSVSGDVRLPLSAGMGIAYHSGVRWVFAANGLYEPWSTFESDLPFAGLGEGEAGTLADRVRISGGAQYLPAGTNQLAPYLARVAYRLGAYFDRAYVTPVPDVDVNTMALTGGLSLPTLLSGTRLDVNFEIGARGTTENDLVRDVFYRLSVNVNVGERWFETQRLR